MPPWKNAPPPRNREEVLLRVNEQRNILHEISKRKANWIGHILRRNCLLQQVIEGKIKRGIEVTGRRGRRRRKLLDDLKDRRRYCHLKEEALDRTVWRACFGRGFGSVVRQTTKWIYIYIYIHTHTHILKANWIGHILRRNCLLQQVIEGKIKRGIEVTGRRGRRRRKLLDELKDRRRYCQLKEEALDCTVWRARFGRGFGPVVRLTAEWMNATPPPTPHCILQISSP